MLRSGLSHARVLLSRLGSVQCCADVGFALPSVAEAVRYTPQLVWFELGPDLFAAVVVLAWPLPGMWRKRVVVMMAVTLSSRASNYQTGYDHALAFQPLIISLPSSSVVPSRPQPSNHQLEILQSSANQPSAFTPSSSRLRLSVLYPSALQPHSSPISKPSNR